jgi:hypothetical protein
MAAGCQRLGARRPGRRRITFASTREDSSIDLFFVAADGSGEAVRSTASNSTS